MQSFTVPGGGQDTIETLSFVTSSWPRFSGATFGNPDGMDLSIAIWSDPDGNGDPNDAVLLGSTTGLQIYNGWTGLFATYSFATPIQVSGSFFAGYALQIDANATNDFYSVGSLDTSMLGLQRSYRFSKAFNPIDLQNLGANVTVPTNWFVFGVHMLRLNDGLFEAPIGASSSASPTLNSRGDRSLLYANGNTDQTRGAYSLNLSANLLPPQQFGFFLASADSAPGFTPMGSQGQLCLGGRILRINSSAAEGLAPKLTFKYEGLNKCTE